jgi:hypothetical protein
MPRRTSETKKAGLGTDGAEANSSLISPSECDMRELIALRAYELYVQRGAAGGDEATDWLTAEAEVLSCLRTNPLYEPPRVPRSVNGTKKAAPKLAARSRKTLGATSSRKTRPRSEAA